MNALFTTRQSIHAVIAPLLVSALSGCSNPFADHYRQFANHGTYLPDFENSPELVATEALESRRNELKARNMVQIGQSVFRESKYGWALEDALAQGRVTGARVVLFSERSAGVQSSTLAVNVPQTRQEYERWLTRGHRAAAYNGHDTGDEPFCKPGQALEGRSPLGYPMKQRPDATTSCIVSTVDVVDYLAEYWGEKRAVDAAASSNAVEN